jgi:hypothetical protein
MVAVAGGGADGYRGDQQLFPCGSRSQASNEVFFFERTMYRLIVTGWVYLSVSDSPSAQSPLYRCHFGANLAPAAISELARL